MKEGYLLKRKTEHGVVSPQELEKINQYTRREFQAQELYTFSVVLCDNQVDRDFECFTKAALEKLKELFLGKTGIFDHSMRSGGQTARIYDCRVEPCRREKTSWENRTAGWWPELICPERPKIRILLQSWIPPSKRRSA